MERAGHKVLRPYHPDLNPIENIWAIVKQWVAKENTTFKLDDVESLVRKKFELMTSVDWEPICNRVLKLEQQMIDNEHLLDQNREEFQFVVNTMSSDEKSSDSEFSDEPD